MRNKPECLLLDLGTVDYPEALTLQKKVVCDVIAGRASHTIISCEHPHTITYSRRAKKENILVSQGALENLGVSVHLADRGGDVTYHGPGQAVLYPIFDLKKGKRDLGHYLRGLEEVVIRALRNNFGLNAFRKPGMTGVWVGPYKVSSIGIGVRHWVTYHGLSLNVKVDKKYSKLVKPCGMDTKCASINDFFDEIIDVETVRDMLLESLCDVFDLKVAVQGAGQPSAGGR